jgi:hypothetical protein
MPFTPTPFLALGMLEDVQEPNQAEDMYETKQTEVVISAVAAYAPVQMLVFGK